MENVNNQVFYLLVKAGLWGKEARISPYKEIDFSEVYRIAEEQSVIGLVAAGLEHVSDMKVPQQWALQFAGQTIQLENRNKAMNEFIAVLVGKMRAAGIYTLLVKGQGVAQCYEKPLWRTGGDVDFFLSDANYKKAKELLIPMASEVEKELEGAKHLGMNINGWEVELHGSLHVGLPNRINRELDVIQRDTFYNGNVRSWINNGTLVLMLGKENDIVYVFVHFFNHFYKEGVGLRQICDWCRLLWVYRDEIDEKKIEGNIKKMNLMTEWKAFGAFAVDYLGMPRDAMPFYSAESKWKKKAEKICAFILETGNMGHNRDLSHYSKNQYLVRKSISMGRRIGDLINHARIFPLDSLRFLPAIMFNGVRSAMRGE